MKRLMIFTSFLIVGLASCTADRPKLAPRSATVSAEARSEYAATAVPSVGFTMLVSNDDGYEAPGIRALISALRSVGRVVVAAPAVE